MKQNSNFLSNFCHWLIARSVAKHNCTKGEGYMLAYVNAKPLYHFKQTLDKNMQKSLLAWQTCPDCRVVPPTHGIRFFCCFKIKKSESCQQCKMHWWKNIVPEDNSWVIFRCLYCWQFLPHTDTCRVSVMLWLCFLSVIFRTHFVPEKWLNFLHRF